MIIYLNLKREKLLTDKVLHNFNLLQKISGVEKFISNFKRLNNKGLAIFGGCIRDWYLDRKPNDIDLVSDYSDSLPNLLSEYKRTNNMFNGNIIIVSDIVFDVWNLSETTFIKQGLMKHKWETLVKMVPFNISAIIIVLDGWLSTNPADRNRATIFENGFFNAMDTRTIDFVNDCHPDSPRIAARAVKMSERYQFGMSYNVQQFVDKHLSKTQQKKIRAIELGGGFKKKSSNSSSNKEGIINELGKAISGISSGFMPIGHKSETLPGNKPAPTNISISVGTPEFVGTIPIRHEIEVLPADSTYDNNHEQQTEL